MITVSPKIIIIYKEKTMQRKIAITSICLLLLSLFLAVGQLQAGDEKVDEKLTVAGKIVPLAFDENDKVVVVSIEGTDGSYYDVAPEGKNHELLGLTGKNIEAVGHLIKDEDGYELLLVEAYKIIE